ncbi:MAG TPA: imidazolonepropionase [Steroidobacteraceae bacterium]|nr:imidazolonepropionase [Steroidobacteraceae bacterium]
MSAYTDREIWDRVWIGADLATMTGRGLGVIENGVIAVRNGRIAWVGSRDDFERVQWQANVITDAAGLWITPGLIECHTHLVYAGDRSHEFSLRLTGATYEEIARAGGGILSTVKATRAASEEALLEASLTRARRFVEEGVTTLEIKSGYGLDLPTELKLLRVARRIGETLGIHTVATFLGAHAIPPEYTGRSDEYVALICDEMLPAVIDEGLADAADVFCERIAFSPEQTRRIFERARSLGLALRMHADQLSDSEGALLAAECAVRSADHLEHASEKAIEAMARHGVVAGLLPGAFYYLRETRKPPIAFMRKHSVDMAVSSDCNPGTSPMSSLLLAANMACVQFGLTVGEALRGITICAARALGLDSDRGTLEIGKRADLAIWRIRHPEQLCSEMAAHRPCEVVIGC